MRTHTNSSAINAVNNVILALLVVLALALISPKAANAENLVTNGSFESGDFAGWTTEGDFTNAGVTSGAFYQYSGAQDGAYYSYLGTKGSDATLSQTFNAGPGQYTLGFWLNGVGDQQSSIAVYLDGVLIKNIDSLDYLGYWDPEFFDVDLSLCCSPGAHSLQFVFRDDVGYMALDNVSLTEVPEPSSMLLLGSGALTLGGVIRRKLYGRRVAH